jgi:hypothetical protein
MSKQIRVFHPKINIKKRKGVYILESGLGKRTIFMQNVCKVMEKVQLEYPSNNRIG